MQNAPTGVIPAIPTPFTADGREVDVDALRRVVRHVVDVPREPVDATLSDLMRARYSSSWE